MSELELAEAVAQLTADRMRESFKEELGLFRDQWMSDMAKLRDDLTAKSLLNSAACGLDCPLKDSFLSKLTGAKVLVVDDYPEVRKVLARLLTEAGIVAFEAVDAPTAVEVLSNEAGIEVIIADIAMPKNGYTLLEYVRKHYPTIEVVMTSGYDTEVERARAMGAFGFLAKPFTAAQAVLVVEKAVEMKRLKAPVSKEL